VAYVRTVRTASGATAVQIVYSNRRGSRTMEHVGSAHDEAELEALKAAARQRLAAGQGELDLGMEVVSPAGPLEIVSARMGPLWDALCRAYEALGLGQAAGGDAVFRDLVLTRIIEPTSKLDSLRVLAEVGVDPVSYRTVERRLPSTPQSRGDSGWPRLVPRTRGWGRQLWCSTTCPRSTSRPTPPTGSGSPGSPRNAASSRRSPSGC